MVPLFAGRVAANTRKTCFACVFLLLACIFISNSHSARRGECELQSSEDSHSKFATLESSLAGDAVASTQEQPEERQLFLKIMIRNCTISSTTLTWLRREWLFSHVRRKAAPFVEVKVGKMEGDDVRTFKGSVTERTSQAGDGLNPVFNQSFKFDNTDDGFNSFQLTFWFDSDNRTLGSVVIPIPKLDSLTHHQFFSSVDVQLTGGSSIRYQLCQGLRSEESKSCFHRNRFSGYIDLPD
eukprot:TRINITY_DN10606_c0_g1_i1.p1 TRINITY_DN10606_c0_g1~~TRINITY_DN10606_c0_g1_i1.p1  ORF type:complete len:239 (-),score=13.61 TRINITY_DN10606_c0_g1_i1:233-949(-)